jgi:hypothetical protein
MDKKLFSMQCNKLSIETRCEENINAQGFLTPLWNAFSYLQDKRFAEMIEHLCATWRFRKFPVRADFENALTATRKETYQPEKRNKNIEPYGQEAANIRAKFKIMDEVRDMVCKPILGNYDSKNPPLGNTWPIMRKFYRDMVETGNVYSLQTKQWIDKNAAQNFTFFDPAEMGFPV